MKAGSGANDRMVVVYDGECPFCANYVHLMGLRKSVGDVDLVDARTHAPVVQDLVDHGYDLNEGMAAIFGGRTYHGSDAVILISSLSGERSWVGRSIAALLARPGRARLFYPVMKLGRRIVLKALGKPLL
jgi:predicted DCC family thiol-disulfide oxidoreductase YuxK